MSPLKPEMVPAGWIKLIIGLLDDPVLTAPAGAVLLINLPC